MGSFLFEDLHDPAQRDRVLGLAERVGAFVAAAGGGVFVVIDKPDAIRVATAGRSDAAPRLDDDRWRRMVERFDEIAAIARRHEVRPVAHPHVGGYVEFADEIERLVDDTDLELCLDTGHLAYAGIDPAAAIRRHGDRLGHVHLKDVRPDVLARVVAEGLSFWEAIAADIFCPLGDGVVDLEGVVQRAGRRRVPRPRDHRAGPGGRDRCAARRPRPEPRRDRGGEGREQS